MPEDKDHNNQQEDLRQYFEQKIVELENIKNQYIGAIEAYKDVLNTIVDREQDEEGNKVTEIKENL